MLQAKIEVEFEFMYDTTDVFARVLVSGLKGVYAIEVQYWALACIASGMISR